MSYPFVRFSNRRIPAIAGSWRAALGIMLLATCTFADGPKAPIYSGADQAKRLIVRIENELIEGAGILVHVDDTGLYGITARHVLMTPTKRPRSELRVQTRIWNKTLPIEGFKYHMKLDLGVFRVLAADLPLSVRQIREALRFDVLGDVDALERGDPVVPIGHASSGAWIVPTEPVGFAGVVASSQGGLGEVIRFEHQCEIGHSGGGVFDDSWRLLAMMFQDDPPFCRALRLDWIIGQLQEWRVPISLVSAPIGDQRNVGRPQEIVAAVIDFDNRTGRKLPKIGPLASDILSSHLYSLPRVRLVTRDRLDVVLKEQSLPGVRLNELRSPKGLARTGQLLKADVVVTGSVIRYDVERRSLRPQARLGGASWTVDVHRMAISLKVIEVDTGRVRFQDTYDVERQLEYSVASTAPRDPVSAQNELLDQLIDQAGADLRRAVAEISVGLEAAGQLVRVPITSRPEGAEVIVDGVYIGVTPLTIDRIVGLVEIEIRRPGFHSWRNRVQVEPGAEIPVLLVPIAAESER